MGEMPDKFVNDSYGDGSNSLMEHLDAGSLPWPWENGIQLENRLKFFEANLRRLEIGLKIKLQIGGGTSKSEIFSQFFELKDEYEILKNSFDLNERKQYTEFFAYVQDCLSNYACFLK